MLRWIPLIGLAWAAAGRGAVEFEPGLSAGVTHTDNLTLAAEDIEHETVYQVTPTFSLVQDAPRMNTNVNWSAEGYYYDDRSDSEIYQNFTADFQAALDPDNLFFEIGAARDQSIRDPEAPISRSNLPITGNRVDRDNYYIGPTFAYPFGDNATASGSLTRSWIRYDDTDADDDLFVRDFQTDTFSFSLDNYRRERGFTWAARYDEEKTDYEVFPPWEFRQAAVELGAWIGGGLRLFASGGKESAWDDPFDPSLEDSFWEAGFAKAAEQGLSFELAAGERTFGSSKRASASFVFSRGSAELSYSEQPTTQGREPYSDLALPSLLPGDLDDFLNRPGLAERFISKRLDWALSFELRRTGFSARIFSETREERSRIDGIPLGDEEQSGGSVSATWRAGTRTELQLTAERARRQFGFGREQDLRAVSVGAEYTLGPRTGLVLEISRAKEDSEGAGDGLNYHADLVSLLFTRTF